MPSLRLETPRLIIRRLSRDDLEPIHRILDVELREADFGSESASNLAERKTWLDWTILSYEQLEKLYQPPYGERAMQVVGSIQHPEAGASETKKA